MIVQTDNDREGLRKSGSILATVLDAVEQALRLGITTKELDSIAEKKVRALGGTPAFLGHNGFPASLCVSINEGVVHGVPGDYSVRNGDVISIDFGVDYEGYYTDAARTIVVGEHDDPRLQQLMIITKRALDAGIAAAVSGNTIGDIGYAIQSIVEPEGFGLIRDLVGHGVGADVHEDPSIPNYGSAGGGAVLEDGLVLAIEPMVTMGGEGVERGPDGQIYQTQDQSIAVHFEHTVIVGSDPEIVTIA